MNKKIRAFTIFELIIVMIISSALIYATLAVFVNTEKIFEVSLRDSYRDIELLEFEELLRSDIDKGEYIYAEKNKIIIETNNPVEYYFDDFFVYRNVNQQTDTFFIQTEDLKIEKLNLFNNLVKYVSFTIPKMNDTNSVEFSKKYTRSQLFNINIINNEHRLK